uniref:Uncharacterized protein n=2 Tax=Physcomitrium patens TaxID=3218 RepID=A0A7I3ZXP7_PHYPA
MDQKKDFFESFEALCTKALIDHCTISKNHLEVDGLIEQVVQTIKYDLRKCIYNMKYLQHLMLRYDTQFYI